MNQAPSCASGGLACLNPIRLRACSAMAQSSRALAVPARVLGGADADAEDLFLHLNPTPSMSLFASVMAQGGISAPVLPATVSRPRLFIPGPTEFTPNVLQAMSLPSQSHTHSSFLESASEVLSSLRRVVQTADPAAQPFVLSGSGTLGFDQVGANLTAPGDAVLTLVTGTFGDALGNCLEAYLATVDRQTSPVGQSVNLEQLAHSLKAKAYKLVTVTHVDTSTGVRADLGAIARVIRRVSPKTLFVVDAICSLGAEDLAMDDMHLDVVIAAPQKAIGCPSGLSIVMASRRAMAAYQARAAPPVAWFASWKNWLPIMKAYEAKKPAYFATPNTQLIGALKIALRELLADGLARRLLRHQHVSARVKQSVEALGLRQICGSSSDQASTMTAAWLPAGVSAPDVAARMEERGAIIAGGLLKGMAGSYIRIGHMGVSVMEETEPVIRGLMADLSKVIDGLVKEREALHTTPARCNL